MTARRPHLPTSPLALARLGLPAAALLLVAALVPGAVPAQASPAAAPASGRPEYYAAHDGSSTLRVPGSRGAPGYQITVASSPFQVTTSRGGATALQTTAGAAGSSGPADFRTAAGWATATSVQNANWHDGVLDLTLTTTVPGASVDYRITPRPDRYQVSFSVHGATATQVASHYLVAPSGHWYGQGEAQTSDGGP